MVGDMLRLGRLPKKRSLLRVVTVVQGEPSLYTMLNLDSLSSLRDPFGKSTFIAYRMAPRDRRVTTARREAGAACAPEAHPDSGSCARPGIW